MKLRQCISFGLVVAAFIAAAPAFAQRQSLSERIEALEAQSENVRSEQSQSNIELLNTLAALQAELAQLRGMVERLQHENEQLKTNYQNQYLDLDARLSALEKTPVATDTPDANPIAVKPTAQPAKPEATQKPQSPAPAEPGQRSEREMYDAAFESLKNGEYAEAAKRFDAFLKAYPDGALAPNAWYWHGESYYVTQNYEIALEAFQALLTNFPKSEKAPHALLKLGYCQHELGMTDQAKTTLQSVIDTYPASEPARLAESRLRLLSQGRI